VRHESFGLTDRGLRRYHNEDAFLIRDDLGLYVVADGMGGHAAGEVASDLAVREVEAVIETTGKFAEDTWPNDWDPTRSLAANRIGHALLAAHRRVTAAVAGDAGLRGMGATIVAALIDWEGMRAAVAHVGDSRAYLFSNGNLSLLTADHSWVHEQVVAGLLSEEAARNHPLKNVVTRALGGVQEPEVDIQEREFAVNDILLLCSDGLNTMLENAEIARILARRQDLATAARELVSEANRKGGIDNITVVLARGLP